MSQPTKADIHIDVAMTNISIAYKNAFWVADRVFPSVVVKKDSDKYFTFDRGPWFRDDAKPRGPGARSAESGYTLGSGTYNCVEWALKKLIPDEERDNADLPLQPDTNATEFLTNAMMLRKERAVSAIVGAWAATEDAAGLWKPPGSTNTILLDIATGKSTIRRAIGRYPNKLLIDSKTFEDMKNVDDILQRIKYMGSAGSPATVTAQALAAIFELDEVLVGGAIYSSAEETAAGDDFTALDVWDKNATKGLGFLFYAPSSPTLMDPAAGYIIQSLPRTIDRWREIDEKCDVLRISEAYAIEQTSANAGYLFTDTHLT